jgi:protein-glutamine gamma-glutamyltransferase
MASGTAITKPTGWRRSLQALGGNLGADWERDRRDTLFLMVAIAICFCSHISHLPIWVTVAFVILFLWRLGLVMSGRWLPGPWVRVVAAIAASLGVYAYYQTVVGREPGTALLVLFLGLKLMEMRAKRDFFVVVFLCLFLLILAFLFSQSIGTLIIVFTALLFLLTALISMQFGYHEATIKQRFRIAAVLLLRALPIAVVLFFLFPRIEQPLWKMPGSGSRATTGLSDHMAPGSITELSESDELVFRVLFSANRPPPNSLYWRGPTFGQFDGQRWGPVKHELGAPPAPQVARSPGAPSFEYEITLEPTNQNLIFLLEHPLELPALADRTVQVQADLSIVSGKPIEDRIRYKATSVIGGKIGLNETTLSKQNWLSLPPGHNGKTLQMAIDWRNEEPDETKLVQRALKMFREQEFYYTLKPPQYGKDGVDQFLFEKRRGFCEHYAQSFVVLMRALDIPARVVTGYQGGEYNPIDGFLSIKQRDAHAWAEVWLDGKGWVRVDPTAAVHPSRVEKKPSASSNANNAADGSAGLTLAESLRFRIEAISNQWKQWLLNYDKAKQRNLFAKLGLDLDDWHHLVGLLAVGMGLALGIVALVTLRQRVKPDPVEQSFARACQKLTQFGLQKSKSETPLQFAQRAQQRAPAIGEQFRAIVLLYMQIRYAQDKPGQDQIVQLKQMVKALAG